MLVGDSGKILTNCARREGLVRRDGDDRDDRIGDRESSRRGGESEVFDEMDEIGGRDGI